MNFNLMSTQTSQSVAAASSHAAWKFLATTLEVLLVYAGILLYIWRWQFTHPRVWTVLLACVLASHILHRDSLRNLGLTFENLRPSAQSILPLALALFLPITIYGFASGKLLLVVPNMRTLMSFAGYGLWSLFQQYVTQSYFHNRLMHLVDNHHLSSLMVALMFGGAHIPNEILMIATTFGGFILAEVFARHRNIYPLALAHAVGGFLIAALTPAALIHNMRVGPGYFFFGLR